MHKKLFTALVLSQAVRNRFLSPPGVDRKRKIVSRFATVMTHFVDLVNCYRAIQSPRLECFLSTATRSPMTEDYKILAYAGLYRLSDFAVYHLPRYKSDPVFDYDIYKGINYLLLPEMRKVFLDKRSGKFEKPENWSTRFIKGLPYPTSLDTKVSAEIRKKNRKRLYNEDLLGLFSFLDMSQYAFCPGALKSWGDDVALEVSKIVKPGIYSLLPLLDMKGSRDSLVARSLQKNPYLKNVGWERAFLNIQSNAEFVRTINNVKLTNGQTTKFSVIQDVADLAKIGHYFYRLGRPDIQTLQGAPFGATAIMYSAFKWWGNTKETSNLMKAFKAPEEQYRAKILCSLLLNRVMPAKYKVWDPEKFTSSNETDLPAQMANYLGFFISMCCDMYGYNFLQPVCDPKQVFLDLLEVKKEDGTDAELWLDAFEGVNSAHYALGKELSENLVDFGIKL